MRQFRHHVLEGLLRRLADSEHRTRFVLRGGLMTRAWVGGRSTRDLDMVGLFTFDIEGDGSLPARSAVRVHSRWAGCRTG